MGERYRVKEETFYHHLSGDNATGLDSLAHLLLKMLLISPYPLVGAERYTPSHNANGHLSEQADVFGALVQPAT